MFCSTKSSECSSFSRRLAVTVHVGRWLMKVILFVFISLGFLLICRPVAAMFVSSSEEEGTPQKAQRDADSTDPDARQPTQGTPGGTPTRPGEAKPGTPTVSPSRATMPPEVINLRERMRDIYPAPPRKRKVNSNRFVRMAGEKDKLKPVTVAAPTSKTGLPSPTAAQKSADPQERIFSIGSWIFVLTCVGAAVIGLLRIRRLTGSN